MNMKKAKFILDLKEEMEIESELDINTNLKALDEWDSLNAMVLKGYVSENFDVNLTPNDINDITTIASLISKIGPEKFVD